MCKFDIIDVFFYNSFMIQTINEIIQDIIFYYNILILIFQH